MSRFSTLVTMMMAVVLFCLAPTRAELPVACYNTWHPSDCADALLVEGVSVAIDSVSTALQGFGRTLYKSTPLVLAPMPQTGDLVVAPKIQRSAFSVPHVIIPWSVLRNMVPVGTGINLVGIWANNRILLGGSPLGKGLVALGQPAQDPLPGWLADLAVAVIALSPFLLMGTCLYLFLRGLAKPVVGNSPPPPKSPAGVSMGNSSPPLKSPTGVPVRSSPPPLRSPTGVPVRSSPPPLNPPPLVITAIKESPPPRPDTAAVETLSPFVSPPPASESVNPDTMVENTLRQTRMEAEMLTIRKDLRLFSQEINAMKGMLDANAIAVERLACAVHDSQELVCGQLQLTREHVKNTREHVEKTSEDAWRAIEELAEIVDEMNAGGAEASAPATRVLPTDPYTQLRTCRNLVARIVNAAAVRK